MTDKEKLDLKQKIRDYEYDLLKWMYGNDDQRERGDERQLAEIYMYEDQGGW